MTGSGDMELSRVQRAWRRAKRFVPVLVFGSGCVLVGRGVSGCGRERPALVERSPVMREGVPIVRVLVSRGPAEKASIATTAGYRLLVDGQIAIASRERLPSTGVSRNGDTWYLNDLPFNGSQLHLHPSKDGCVSVLTSSYRGSLRFAPVGEKKFLIINHVDMESYLAGVLPKELYASWAPEAYHALAVAARTFAMYHILTFGESHEYDLGSTQAAQVYGGFPAETDKSWAAVRSTHGQVLTWGPERDERVFMAQYSASCGGWVNGADVIRDTDNIPPLRGGQRCTSCRNCPRYRWEPVRITKVQLHKALGAFCKAVADLPKLTELRIREKTTYGRIVWVDVLGGGGQEVRLRAEAIRTALLRSGVPAARKLHSMNCRFRDLGDAIEFHDGKGFGHGVGLCQWGAQGKAVKGAAGEEILEFYYPQAKIVRAY